MSATNKIKSKAKAKRAGTKELRSAKPVPRMRKDAKNLEPMRDYDPYAPRALI